jgi:RNA polymerase sigma factor (sigma-70 family)
VLRMSDVERTLCMERPRQDWADSVLVERLRRGDPSALAEAYETHAGLVHGLALRVLRDGRAADEVTEQVFVTLWQAPEGFDRGWATLRSFLAATAHRHAVDVLRRRDGDGAAGDTFDTDTFDTDTVHTDTRGADAQDVLGAGAVIAGTGGDSARVHRAVERLPAAQRRALELAYFRGRTCRQVADEMGVSVSTAKSCLRLGLQGIAESLRGEVSQRWA